jgi:hypothetical protein
MVSGTCLVSNGPGNARNYSSVAFSGRAANNGQRTKKVLTLKCMYLIQILLPLTDENKVPFPDEYYATLAETLTKKFGGVTAYMPSPATGLWKEDQNTTVKDQIAVLEVMAEQLDVSEWKKIKDDLARKFRQEEILMRTFQVTIL